MNNPKRVAFIGFDCPVVPLLQKYVDEGLLPNFKKVFDAGTVAENCLVPFPTITPPNWTTIATGARIGTHQVTDFWLLKEGKTPDASNIFDCFDSKYVQAETLWEAMAKAGKKPVVLNWPTSWPPKVEGVTMVGGGSLTPIERSLGVGNGVSEVSLCSNQLISNGFYPMAIRGQFEPAEDWANLDEPGDEPMEMAAELEFPSSDDKPAPTTWFVLARQSGGEGYDTATLSPTRDMKDAFCTLHTGEWSPKVWTKVKMADGREREVFFAAKLLELSPDAENFRLWLTALVDPTILVSPKEVAKKIVTPTGIPVPEGGLVETMLGLIDLDTFAENSALYNQYLADCAKSLLADGDWDGFFMHCHPTDFTYHVLATRLDPDLNPDEADRKLAWDCHQKVYESADKMLGQILELMPKDTLVILLSDHGAVPDGPTFDPFKALVPKG
ncbi:MAG: alkaline phosphatase family protein, partial [Chloroflexota bacterium]